MRWMMMWLCTVGLLLGANAAVEILDLPDTLSGEPLDARYDIEWAATAAAGGALLLDVETSTTGGYQLKLEKGQASWLRVANRKVLPIATAALRPPASKDTYHFTLKRREGVVALLQGPVWS